MLNKLIKVICLEQQFSLVSKFSSKSASVPQMDVPVTPLDQTTEQTDQYTVTTVAEQTIIRWLAKNYSTYAQCQSSIKKDKMLLELEGLINEPIHTMAKIKAKIKLLIEQHQTAKLILQTQNIDPSTNDQRAKILEICPLYFQLDPIISEKDSHVVVKRNQWENDGVAGKSSMDILVNWLKTNFDRLQNSSTKVILCEEVVKEMLTVGITHRNALSIRAKIISLQSKYFEVLAMLPHNSSELLTDAACECVYKRFPLFAELSPVFGYSEYPSLDLSKFLDLFKKYKPSAINHYIAWTKDVTFDGQTCQDILMKWLTTPGNYARYIDKKIPTISTAFEVVYLLAKSGLHYDSVDGIIQKIMRLETTMQTIKETFNLTRDGTVNQTVKDMYPFYYDLVDIILPAKTSKKRGQGQSPAAQKKAKQNHWKAGSSWKSELTTGKSAEEILVDLLKVDDNFARFKAVPPNVDQIQVKLSELGMQNCSIPRILTKIAKIEESVLKYRDRFMKSSYYDEAEKTLILRKKCMYYNDLEGLISSFDGFRDLIRRTKT